MEIYLIRHTTPAVEKGTCYGQSDLDVAASFEEEASSIKTFLPGTIETVYSSPLQRCTKLARFLFPSNNIQLDDELKEIACGKWEMQHWSDIPAQELDPWMNDFVYQPFPGGENYIQLHERVVSVFRSICIGKTDTAVISHGGVMRSILSYITNTDLKDSFTAFKLHYGCVVKLSVQSKCITHQIVSNHSPLV